nr:MAG TPA: hypothetical protein [Caudoviricetes sp.]
MAVSAAVNAIGNVIYSCNSPVDTHCSYTNNNIGDAIISILFNIQ